MKNCIKNIKAERDAFSLILVLVILLVASLFISVSFFMVENYSSISYRKTARFDAYNLAVSSVEAMKAGLEAELARGKLPVARSSVNGWITSEALKDLDNDGYFFDGLIATTSDWSGSSSGSYGGMSFDVFAYDLNYKSGENLKFVKNIPPQYALILKSQEDGVSEKETNYKGEAGLGSVYPYMIRTTVTDRYGKRYIVEQIIKRIL